MNPQVEELRKRAFIVYGGHEGVEAVEKEIKKHGIHEDKLNEYDLKTVLNNIIRNVFIGKIGLEETKIILAQKITHVPGYKGFVELDNEKTVIASRIDFMSTISKAIVIIGILIIAGVWFYVKSFDPVQVCAEKETIALKDECYKNVALSLMNQTICDRITDRMLVLNCYYGVAIKTKDAAICDMIPTETPEVYAIYAKCLTCMANANRNATLCNKLPDVFARGQCQEKTTSDSSIACSG